MICSGLLLKSKSPEIWNQMLMHQQHRNTERLNLTPTLLLQPNLFSWQPVMICERREQPNARLYHCFTHHTHHHRLLHHYSKHTQLVQILPAWSVRAHGKNPAAGRLVPTMQTDARTHAAYWWQRPTILVACVVVISRGFLSLTSGSTLFRSGVQKSTPNSCARAHSHTNHIMQA